jgi:hypothetical protein
MTIPEPSNESTLQHSTLAMTSFCFGIVTALAWLSLPILDKTMSLGEPFGSMFIVLPTFVVAVAATFTGIAFGIASYLTGRSTHPRSKKILAVFGVLLSVASPIISWIIAILS